MKEKDINFEDKLWKAADKLKEESLVDYADRLGELYTKEHDLSYRKIKGQYFTPKQVSIFMASLFIIKKDKISILDPGGGIGILTAAICERLLCDDKRRILNIDVYENDPRVLPFLALTLRACKSELENKGHSVEYRMHDKDFILQNKEKMWKSDLFNNMTENKYDFIISNPPYFKLNKNSPHARIMADMVNGQPNIYPFFMALSSEMLKPGGEMVFITPRSFCSGLYYKRFIGWFLEKNIISYIHVFRSRKEIFDKDEVLQENIIIKAKKALEREKVMTVTISSSRNKSLSEIRRIKAKYSDVIYRRNKEAFIRIPTSKTDLKVLKVFDSWQKTFSESGLEISTGPVVPFRAKQFLVHKLMDSCESVPLLWMHNLKDMTVIWPVNKIKKALSIQKRKATIPLLLPVKNYVLLKRFSSKEQKRRIYSAALLESEFPYELIGFENHLNYIHRHGSKLSINEVLGITSFLNTKLMDNYFRSLNGNTQVNATDIRHMPFPDIKKIIEIGKTIDGNRHNSYGHYLDMKVADILKIDRKLITELFKGDNEDG